MTNIPGPQVPLYVLGRQLHDLFPIAFLPRGHALAVAIMSYNGEIGYGLLGDFDALNDIEVFATGLDEALAELLDAAQGKKPARGAADRSSARAEQPNGRTAPILPTTGTRPKRGPAADMRAKRSRSGSRSRTPRRPQS